jgi:hypothetical protein
MKVLCFVLLGSAALAQNITFTNRTATFTNLEGRLFFNVTLIKTNQDGVIWSDDSGGGQVSYTNLSPALLQEWGIPLERIEEARVRAGKKAVADAQRRAALAAQQVAELEAKQKERAGWDAAAAAKAVAAQRQADLQAIKSLEEYIEAAEAQAKRMDAAAPTQVLGNDAYMRNARAKRSRADVALEEVREAKEQLKQMKADYAEKHPSE